VNLVRIAGLMRSGSNLLTWMLRHNFAGVQTATMLLGWKHGPIIRGREPRLEDFVDPRFREGIRSFVRDRPGDWARVAGSAVYEAAVAALRSGDFGVALAVRDPALWFASCARIQRQAPGFLPHDMSPAAAAAVWNGTHRDWLEALGPRSVIVDTDALRRDPGPWLARIAAGLGLKRLPAVQVPEGYLHPQGTEELYELLGAPVTREMDREFTTLGDADPGELARFSALLDRGVLARLGLDTDRRAS
jgi:hypothetical protein